MLFYTRLGFQKRSHSTDDGFRRVFMEKRLQAAYRIEKVFRSLSGNGRFEAKTACTGLTSHFPSVGLHFPFISTTSLRLPCR